MAYQIWLTRVILDALPQAVILIAFLPVIVYIALRSLKGSKAKVWEAEQVYAPSEGQLRIWLRRIELVIDGAYSRERFDHQLGQLLLQIIAHQERLPIREALRRIDSGAIDLPAEIAPYIQAAVSTGFAGKRKPLQWLRDLLERQRPDMTREELERHVTPALQYIERQLRTHSVEVYNDN